MISCINEILDLIIKTSIVFGIVCVCYSYFRLLVLDQKIEKLNKKFESQRDGLIGQGRGIEEEIINGQIEELNKEKIKKIDPIERERNRLLSKIPFLK